jgi:hypothetical protein
LQETSPAVEYIRARPGKLNYASSNSAAQLAVVQFLMANKLDMVHVPYKGDPPALADMLGDRIHMMFTTGTTAPPLVREGKIKALATLLTERSPLLPDVPTGAEAGLQALTIVPWAAFFGPAGMAPEVTARLSREIGAALAASARSDVKQGFSPTPSRRRSWLRSSSGTTQGRTFKEAASVRLGPPRLPSSANHGHPRGRIKNTARRRRAYVASVDRPAAVESGRGGYQRLRRASAHRSPSNRALPSRW